MSKVDKEARKAYIIEGLEKAIKSLPINTKWEDKSTEYCNGFDDAIETAEIILRNCIDKIKD